MIIVRIIKQILFRLRKDYSQPVEITVNTGAEVVFCDGIKIGHALIQLLSNALIYTKHEDAKVQINISRDDKYSVIAIEDNGIGIPKDAHDKIFEPFFQVADTRHMNQNGSGLGLYAAKRLVRMQGGDITLERKLKKGSKFIIRLPLFTGMSC